ncbi:sucrase ferredoxin [Deinococcus irradiatisoli]|uniref:Sucrase ferredoxin n=1 Tax=Deinococcus irradiatisoli TaxID=2202254 RepID=A0A2Z3JCZ1_9DEIO|nr:sucrase ferredoxin [Deinococcus irradiatisoli]AWN23043.1 sucrase ferredoxin [Deinococcus irradiatisoli]
MSAPARLPRLTLCADASRAAGEDPIGTAPHWQEVTVLELDVPLWAQVRDAATWTDEQRGVFERLRGKVESSGAGFGLLMSAPAQAGGPLRVRHYVQSAVPGAAFVRRDYASAWPQSEWARGLNDTLLEPHHLGSWQALGGPDPATPDLHVCTHGTVDAACGRYGVPVHAALLGAGQRAWRTGHFSGHRFAATAVDLPSGYLWAHLTPDLAVQVARRAVHPAEVAGHLRGFAGLPPQAQVLDRAMLIRHGWPWLEARRWAEVGEHGVTLHFDYGGESGVARAEVRPAAPLLLPGSSHKPDLGEIRQWTLGEVREVRTAP